MCLAHSRISEAEQDSLISSSFATPPVPKLAGFKKPIPDTFQPVGAYAMMPAIWLEWREPAHNLCILVGVINGDVETIFYIATVGIAVAEDDHVCTRSLGHDSR